MSFFGVGKDERYSQKFGIVLYSVSDPECDIQLCLLGHFGTLQNFLVQVVNLTLLTL